MVLLATVAVMVVLILIAARLSVVRVRTREEYPMSRGSAYVDSWGQNGSEDSVSSVRIGGIGAKSMGRELRVKVVARDGQSVLDTLSWIIDGQVSPELRLAAPLPSDSIGAVLIAIE